MSQQIDNLHQTIYQHSRSSATASIYLLTCQIEEGDDGETEGWGIVLRTIVGGELRVWNGRLEFDEIERVTSYQALYDAIITRPSIKITTPKASPPTLIIHTDGPEPLRINLQPSEEAKSDLQALFNLTTGLVTDLNNARKTVTVTPVASQSAPAPATAPAPSTASVPLTRSTPPPLDTAAQKKIDDLQRQLDAANNVAKTLSQQASASQEVRKPVTPVKLPKNSSKLQPGRKVHVKHPSDNEFASDSDSD